MPKPKKYPHNITVTEPDLFIIESLSVADERAERYEGRALRDSLRIVGQTPLYVYVRDSKELKQAIELFRHSCYRFLHVSCHGSSTSLFTTLEEISNDELANLFSPHLRNRRVFFSSCFAGAGNLSAKLQEKNKGLNSVAAPLDEIQFSTATAFWTAFYTRAYIDNPMSMKAADVKRSLLHLCKYFKIRIAWSYWRPKSQEWKQQVINGK